MPTSLSLLKSLLLSSLCLSSLFGAGVENREFPAQVSAQVLYWMHLDEPERALSIYLEEATRSQGEDFSLLQEAAFLLIEKGAKQSDPEVALLSLFGAAIANSPRLLPLLERALSHKEPQIQLAAVHLLSQSPDDEAELMLKQAFLSPFPLIRLETAYRLAGKNHTLVMDQLQALLYKVPKEILFLFPQIVARIPSEEGTKMMQQFLHHEDSKVCQEALACATEAGMDDLLPSIRHLASHPQAELQEGCAHAFGHFRDGSALPFLNKLAVTADENGALTALHALSQLGDEAAEAQILEKAKGGNLFAVALLGENPKAVPLLIELLHHENPDLCLNATLALLKLNHPQGLVHLKELLIRDTRDLGFMPITSPAKGLKAWKALLHAPQKEKQYPTLSSSTLLFKHDLLLRALELPEEEFLQLARLIFLNRQAELVPAVVVLLENHATPGAIALLKEGEKMVGAPLVRMFCTLALFHLKQEGPYFETLLQWLKSRQDEELIRFKEEKSEKLGSPYTLKPEETSQLLIQTFEAAAQAHDPRGIAALIEALAHGNRKNRYALAGLLIRALE